SVTRHYAGIHTGPHVLGSTVDTTKEGHVMLWAPTCIRPISARSTMNPTPGRITETWANTITGYPNTVQQYSGGSCNHKPSTRQETASFVRRRRCWMCAVPTASWRGC